MFVFLFLKLSFFDLEEIFSFIWTKKKLLSSFWIRKLTFLKTYLFYLLLKKKLVFCLKKKIYIWKYFEIFWSKNTKIKKKKLEKPTKAKSEASIQLTETKKKRFYLYLFQKLFFFFLKLFSKQNFHRVCLTMTNLFYFVVLIFVIFLIHSLVFFFFSF